MGRENHVDRLMTTCFTLYYRSRRPMQTVTRWIVDGISSLLFPPCCRICSEPVGNPEEIICETCRKDMVRVSGYICETCGRPLPDGQSVGQCCGRCMIAPPPFERARYGFFHQGNVRRALIDFKYGGLMHHGKGLAQLLSETFRESFSGDDIDLIIPMPMHPRRLIKRGFNQVVYLAGRLAHNTGIPMKRNVLKKIKDTVPQVGLSRSQRLTNVKGSFGVARTEDLMGKRLLLLDDVLQQDPR